MSIVLELTPELESELAAEAAQFGLSLSEYALRILAGHSSPPPVRSGADLVAYWQREGVVGSRPDIADASAHARALRQQAQERPQS